MSSFIVPFLSSGQSRTSLSASHSITSVLNWTQKGKTVSEMAVTQKGFTSNRSDTRTLGEFLPEGGDDLAAFEPRDTSP